MFCLGAKPSVRGGNAPDAPKERTHALSERRNVRWDDHL
jgi:hypothetical protein